MLSVISRWSSSGRGIGIGVRAGRSGGCGGGWEAHAESDDVGSGCPQDVLDVGFGQSAVAAVAQSVAWTVSETVASQSARMT
jgi:hypothetical protein